MFGEREQIRINEYEEPVGRTQRIRQNEHSTRPIFDTVQMARRPPRKTKAKSGVDSVGIRLPQRANIKNSANDSIKRAKIQTICRLCKNHGWEISYAEASHYLNMIETNHLQPRIRNHNSVIIPVGKSFRIIKGKFSGTGTMGRTLDRGGANAVIYHGASPYQPPEKYTAEVVINHRSITGLRKRASPNTVMNGSAYDQTGIVNSEYLHRIAHSLGGSDTSDNLTPGYHALNTAMIPIENFVCDLAGSNV